MQTRRAFIGAVAAIATSVATPMSVVVVRPSVDMDLSGTSLIHAIGLVGDGPLTLQVHPEMCGYAMTLLRKLGWHDQIALVVKPLDKWVDSWSLTDGRRMFYTIGG